MQQTRFRLIALLTLLVIALSACSPNPNAAAASGGQLVGGQVPAQVPAQQQPVAPAAPQAPAQQQQVQQQQAAGNQTAKAAAPAVQAGRFSVNVTTDRGTYVVYSDLNDFDARTKAARLLLEHHYVVRNGGVPTHDSLVRWLTNPDNLAGGGKVICSGGFEKQARQVEEFPINTNQGRMMVVHAVQIKCIGTGQVVDPAVITTDKHNLVNGGRSIRTADDNESFAYTDAQLGPDLETTIWTPAFDFPDIVKKQWRPE